MKSDHDARRAVFLTRFGTGRRSPSLIRCTGRLALAALLVVAQPLGAATIIVDESTCTLVDANDQNKPGKL